MHNKMTKNYACIGKITNNKIDLKKRTLFSYEIQ